MKTEWDYTGLADAYLKRPDYSDAAVDAMLAVMGAKKETKACDVGAGVGHLTLMLAARGLDVTAVEPNDAMRANGIRRTQNASNIRWYEGTAERSDQPSQTFDMITFGSSFNVCDRRLALQEAARILKSAGWFACLWNHRQLDDPIQATIESIIRRHVPTFSYGTRREDQAPLIDSSGLFGPVVHLNSRVLHEQSVAECVEAWRSHASLQRQANDAFSEVVDAIAEYLRGLNRSTIHVPYVTNVWVAQLL